MTPIGGSSDGARETCAGMVIAALETVVTVRTGSSSGMSVVISAGSMTTGGTDAISDGTITGAGASQTGSTDTGSTGAVSSAADIDGVTAAGRHSTTRKSDVIAVGGMRLISTALMGAAFEAGVDTKGAGAKETGAAVSTKGFGCTVAASAGSSSPVDGPNSKKAKSDRNDMRVSVGRSVVGTANSAIASGSTVTAGSVIATGASSTVGAGCVAASAMAAALAASAFGADDQCGSWLVSTRNSSDGL